MDRQDISEKALAALDRCSSFCPECGFVEQYECPRPPLSRWQCLMQAKWAGSACHPGLCLKHMLKERFTGQGRNVPSLRTMAEEIGASPSALSQILKKKRGVSPAMAHKLAYLVGLWGLESGWGDPQRWIQLQKEYEAAELETYQ